MRQALTFALALGGIALARPAAADNTDRPVLRIGNAIVEEGAPDEIRTAVFTVTLEAPQEVSVTVDWSTADLTATRDVDYKAASDQLRFDGPGTQDIRIDIYGDGDASEGSEVFFVRLSSPQNAAIAEGVGHGVIDDDDFVAPSPKCDLLPADGRSNVLFLFMPSTGHSPSHVPFGVNGTVLMNHPPAAQQLAGHDENCQEDWQLVAADDFDAEADKVCDLFWERYGNQVAITGTGENGELEAPHCHHILPLGHPGAGWRLIGSGRLDHNSRADVLWWHEDDRAMVAWMWAQGPAAPVPQSLLEIPEGETKQPVAVADLNGVGRPAVLWRNTETGGMTYTALHGLTLLPEVEVPTSTLNADTGPPSRIVGVGDFNGDAHDDLLWQDASGRMAVWFMRDGAQLASSPTSPATVELDHYDLGLVTGPR